MSSSEQLIGRAHVERRPVSPRPQITIARFVDLNGPSREGGGVFRSFPLKWCPNLTGDDTTTVLPMATGMPPGYNGPGGDCVRTESERERGQLHQLKMFI